MPHINVVSVSYGIGPTASTAQYLTLTVEFTSQPDMAFARVQSYATQLVISGTTATGVFPLWRVGVGSDLRAEIAAVKGFDGIIHTSS